MFLQVSLSGTFQINKTTNVKSVGLVGFNLLVHLPQTVTHWRENRSTDLLSSTLLLLLILTNYYTSASIIAHNQFLKTFSMLMAIFRW